MWKTSLSGTEYFLTFTDEHTRYMYAWVYILKQGSEVFSKFCEWKAMVEKAYGKCIKTLRTDNGGEFTSGEFEEFLSKDGVQNELMISNCPQQNGVAERLKRTLMGMVLCMLSWSGLPQRFWAEALNTAVYLCNHYPTKSVSGMTPYQALTGNKPSVSHLCVFGCSAYCHIAKDEQHKLDAKSRKCIFMGYAENQKGYRLYDVRNQKIAYSRDVRFNKMVRGFEKQIQSTNPHLRIKYENSGEVENEVPNETNCGEESNRSGQE